jgi:hypothetical protein
VPLCHVPVPLHVSAVVPSHWVAPGAQLPVHAPLTHAWFTQTLGVLHIPELHFSTPLPEHCAVPAVHVPTQIPLEHVPLAHAEAEPHSPLGPQTVTALPEHVVCPGVHTPVQAPALQAYGHAVALCQVPLALHICGTAPAHCVAPG